MFFSRALSLCRLRIALFTLLTLSSLTYAQQQINVPAGPLPDSINLLAQQMGIAVVMDEARLSGFSNRALQGQYTAAQALAKLLEGSGFSARQTARGFVIQPGERRVLQTVNVSATALSATTEGTGSLTTSGPVVAATGLDLTLRETPQSVTVITRERLDQQNLTSITDVAEQVTGVFYNNRGTSIGGRTLMYARGYAVDSYQVDGVNVPWETLAESERYGHGSLDTAVYDAVTIVRGSTGLLTGTGEPSALMSLTRKKPTHETQTLVEVGAGSWNHYRGMVDVGGALNESGSLRGRIVGAYDESETWVDGYSNDRTTLYGVVEADLSADTLLTFSIEHGNAGSNGAPWAEDYGSYIYFSDRTTLMPQDTNTSIAPHWSYLDSDRTYLSVALDHQFSDDWRGKLTYGYGKFDSDMRRGMVNAIPANGTPVAARVLSLDYSYDTHIIDAQVHGKYRLLGREHELVAGINLYRNDQAAPLGYYGVIPGQATWSNGRLNYLDPDWNSLPGSEDDYPFDIDVRQEGAYLATRLRPAERLSVILGGRLTNWEYFYADRPTDHHDFYVYSDLDYHNEFTPYAGVVADLTDTFSFYTSYTQIFKPQEARDSNGDLLDPEAGDTVEVGVKGAWFEGRLNASLAAFESKRDNIAVALVNQDGPVLTPKGDQAFIAEDYTKGQGWEFEVAGELTPGWNIQAGYSNFRNKNSDGKVLEPVLPEQMFKLYTDYQLLPDLNLGASLRWQDSTSADPAFITGEAARYDIDSYFLVGANLGYQVTDNLSLDLIVNNLLDEQHRVSNYGYSYGAERNFNLKASYRF